MILLLGTITAFTITLSISINNMSNVIIFGVNDFAQLAHYYLNTDSEHNVTAFCVHREYLPEGNTFEDKPVIPLEEVESLYPPRKFKFFVPMSPKEMNKARAGIYNHLKEKGYEFINYISSKATIFNNNFGDNCFILENNTIQPYTNIGNNVIMWSGNHIGHHSTVGDNVFFSSQVVMSGHCTIESHSFLGVNSSIKDGLTIAEGTLVGMGAVVLNNTESWSVYTGNPAVKLDDINPENYF